MPLTVQYVRNSNFYTDWLGCLILSMEETFTLLASVV